MHVTAEYMSNALHYNALLGPQCGNEPIAHQVLIAIATKLALADHGQGMSRVRGV
jgi:hypothetical protein